jgi:hypothetical protein
VRCTQGADTEIYGVVRWHDEELAEDFVILRTFARRDDADWVADLYREREPDHVFNVVVLRP